MKAFTPITLCCSGPAQHISSPTCSLTKLPICIFNYPLFTVLPYRRNGALLRGRQLLPCRDLLNKMFFNGNRYFCVCIHAAILSYLRFGTFLICLSHDGQTHTCRWCNRRGHFAKDCPNTVCFNCDGLGHKVNECTREELCCICKKPTHLAPHHHQSPRLLTTLET